MYAVVKWPIIGFNVSAMSVKGFGCFVVGTAFSFVVGASADSVDFSCGVV